MSSSLNIIDINQFKNFPIQIYSSMDFYSPQLSEPSNDDLFLKLTKNRTTINANLLEINSFSIDDDAPKIELESQLNIEIGSSLNDQSEEVEEASSQIEEVSEVEEKQSSNRVLRERRKIKNRKETESNKQRQQKKKAILQKEIFKTKQIKEERKKNTNIPKFLTRLLLKNSQRLLPESYSSKYQPLIEQIKLRKTNNYNMNDVAQLLCNSETEKILSKECRMGFNKVLNQAIKKQVILNNYLISSRITYMMASKVYCLRCCSRELIKRLQYR